MLHVFYEGTLSTILAPLVIEADDNEWNGYLILIIYSNSRPHSPKESLIIIVKWSKPGHLLLKPKLYFHTFIVNIWNFVHRNDGKFAE